MQDRWAVELYEPYCDAPDGGTGVLVNMIHCASGVRVEGVVLRYGTEPAFADEVLANTLMVPLPTARRLLVKVYAYLAPELWQLGGGLGAEIALADALRDCWPDGGERLLRSVWTFIRTFHT